MRDEGTAISGRRVTDEVGQIIASTVTREYIYEIFGRLQFAGPSGTERYTAAPAIRSLLASLQVPEQSFTADFLGLEFPAVFASGRPADLMFAAHCDEISYIVPKSAGQLQLGPDNLIPNFAHRPHPVSGATPPEGYPADVVRWCGPDRGYQTVGSAAVHWTTDDCRPHCVIAELDGTPEAGDRVVYAPPVALDPGTGLLTGKVDNRAGVAACVAMCDVLAKVSGHLGVSQDSFNVAVLFPGQEEGPIGAGGGIELAFSRDSRAAGVLLASTGDLPGAWINVDGHDVDPPVPAGLYTPVVSEARGVVVPPHRASRYRAFFEILAEERGIDMRQTLEAAGSASRSDDSGVVGVLPKRIIPLGYACRDQHFNAGLPTAHIDSLVQLTAAMCWIAVAFRGVTRTGTHLADLDHS
jgi:hypothetical protein